MIKFFQKIYNQIMQFDNYTNNYLSVSNHSELPFIAYTNWGMHFAEIKDYDNAIKKLKTAILMYGQNPKPCISLGIIYAKLKQYDEAENILLEAIKRDSESSSAYSVLGSVYIAVDNLSKAEDVLNKALKLTPNDSEIYLNYGILYAKLQKRFNAVKMFKKSLFYNPDNIHASFLLGVMYYEINKISDALDIFKSIEKINNEYKKLNYYMALCFEKNKQFDLVCEYAIKALNEELDNPSVYLLLAHAYVVLDKKEELFKLYQLGQEHNINDFEFFFTEGIVYFKYNEIELAKEALNKALILKPLESNTLYQLGLCYKKEGDIEKALDYYNRAINSNPDNAHALGDLGMLKYDIKDYEAAIKHFTSAITISREKNYLYFYIANCYFKMDKFKKSLEYYEKTLEYYPNHIEAIINITVCLLNLNNEKEALRKIRNAYINNKNSEKIILMYAVINLKCGLYNDASEKADIILSNNPNHKGAKLVKAHTLINLKKPQIALNLLNSMSEEDKKSEIFVYLSFLAYEILVEENPSHYNESMLNLYLDKMKSMESKSLNKDGVISYITKL